MDRSISLKLSLLFMMLLLQTAVALADENYSEAEDQSVSEVPSKVVVNCSSPFPNKGYTVELFEDSPGKWSIKWNEKSSRGLSSLKTDPVNVEFERPGKENCSMRFHSKGKDAQLNLHFGGLDPKRSMLSGSEFVTSKNGKTKQSFPVECLMSKEAPFAKFSGCKLPQSGTRAPASKIKKSKPRKKPATQKINLISFYFSDYSN